MSRFEPVHPHGPIRQVFDGVHVVTGTSMPVHEGQQLQFSRAMTIVRGRDGLVLINTIRLDDDGLAQLDALGKVTAVIRLGAFHGMDDGFYVDRYGADLWAIPGMSNEHDLTVTHTLEPGRELPINDAQLFVFETSKHPEGIVHLARHGGILISCDSLQNWDKVDEFFSEACGAMMTQLGFIKPANIGPEWRRACETQASDFTRLLQLAFKHLLPAHGPPIIGTAHEQLTATIVEVFGLAKPLA